MNPRDTARAYDRLAPQYDVRWRRYLEETLDRTLHCLEGPAPSHLLDVGCGTGEFLRRLRIRYPAAVLVGADPSMKMLEVARRKFMRDPRVLWSCARAETLTFPDERFDGVTCVNTLHCMKDGRAALEEMIRVLRPGGRLVVVDWCRDAWWSRGLNRWHRWVDPAHVWMYTTEELRRMMESRRLRVIRLERFRVSGPGPVRLWEMMGCVGEKP